jgi:hypothetical protein
MFSDVYDNAKSLSCIAVALTLTRSCSASRKLTMPENRTRIEPEIQLSRFAPNAADDLTSSRFAAELAVGQPLSHRAQSNHW